MQTQIKDGHRKLAQLANFLDDLPHDKFHMPVWASDDATEYSCGTAGCACGWAATIFHKEGWHFKKWFPPKDDKTLYIPAYKDNDTGTDSFASFFEIDQRHAYYITCNLAGGTDCYIEKYNLPNPDCITPRHAADRIREVLRQYDPRVLEENIPAVEYQIA